MTNSTHHPNPLSGRLLVRRRGLRLLAWCLAGVVAVTAAPDLEANQVYKACGQKWLRKAKKLTPDQWSWLIEKRVAEVAVDVDGDGVDDTITMTSNPSFRDCRIRENWNLKETTVRVELSTGKTRLFHWINDLLAEKMVIMRGTGRILVTGVNAGGASVSKWVDYLKGTPPPGSLVARHDAPGLAPQPVARTAAVIND